MLSLVWGVPIAAMILAGMSENLLAVKIIYPASQIWMGAACLINARRCGRLHCFLTGPYFVILAFLSLFVGIEILAFGPHTWNLIAAATYVGGIGLWVVPELIWGRYLSPRARSESH